MRVQQHPAAATPTAATATPLAAQVRGHGERIVCLHSSTGSSAQWRRLQEALALRWQVLAPDLHGHGRSPAWPASTTSTLDVDGAAVAAMAGIHAGRSVHLVGHSYGAAVALQIALRHPQQVRSLTLYEPVAFGLLRTLAGGGCGAREAALGEIEEVAASVASLVRAGSLDDAARVFVGYWGGGARAWSALNAGQQQAVSSRMPAVPRHFDALFGAEWDAQLLQRLQMPVLLMQGSATRASASRVSTLLAAALPRAQRVELPGAGHLGPLTHGETVARWMLAHIDPHLASQRERAAA